MYANFYVKLFCISQFSSASWHHFLSSNYFYAILLCNFIAGAHSQGASATHRIIKKVFATIVLSELAHKLVAVERKRTKLSNKKFYGESFLSCGWRDGGKKLAFSYHKKEEIATFNVFNILISLCHH